MWEWGLELNSHEMKQGSDGVWVRTDVPDKGLELAELWRRGTAVGPVISEARGGTGQELECKQGPNPGACLSKSPELHYHMCLVKYKRTQVGEIKTLHFLGCMGLQILNGHTWWWF